MKSEIYLKLHKSEYKFLSDLLMQKRKESHIKKDKLSEHTISTLLDRIYKEKKS